MIPEEQVANYAATYAADDEKGAELVASIHSLLRSGGSSLEPIRIGIVLRERFGMDKAEKFLLNFSTVPEIRSNILFELCYGFAINGDPGRSFAYATMSLDENRLTPEQGVFASVQLARLGRIQAAFDLLEISTNRRHSLYFDALANVQFFRFLASFDYQYAKDLIAKIRALFRNPGIGEIEADISAALKERRPYLLLRMGDGEGSCVRMGLEDEADYNAYYRANKREFLDIWFRDTSMIDSHEFSSVVSNFNEIIKDADCIGGIHNSAIEHEYRLGSRRGIAWVINTMRKVYALGRADPSWAARVPIYSLTIHYDLLLSGCLHRLMQNRQHVGLLSCHSELADKLQRTFGISTIDFFKIPGEQSHAGQLTAEDLEGRHWPDRYNELCSVLDQGDRRGQLFLVAAGFLGKVYAAKLKHSGAVVLDIGAAADMWLGKKTRTFPDLPHHLRLS